MVSRRAFVLGSAGVGGALVVGWSVMPPRQRLLTENPAAAVPGEHTFNGWVRIGSDDRVTVLLAKSEMGQGVSTALAMVLADELDADWSKVRTEPAPVDRIYNNLAMVVDGLPFHPDDDGTLKHFLGWMTAKTMREVGVMATGGSSSVKDLWMPMRQAGSSARAMLVSAAAQTWKVPVGAVTVRSGVVHHLDSGRSLRYGELAERAAQELIPTRTVLKKPAQFTLIGKATRRIDAPGKIDGSARFGIDVLPPGLRYASLVMSPTLGGQVARHDGAAAAAMPGVAKVLAVAGTRGGSGAVAVVADTPWHAMQAARKVSVEWTPGPAAGLSSAGLMQQLAQALDGDDGFGYQSRGDVRSALQGAARTLKAEYRAPLLAHATMEPMNCTVLVKDGQATVWAPTQVPDIARAAAAQALGLPAERVTLNVTLLGGGFGRRLEVDHVAQAAAIARELPGQPVQTFWSREQDMQHDLYRPPCVARYEAGLDAQGRIVAWNATSAGPSIVQQYLARQWGMPAAGPDKTTAEGAFDQPYEWPAVRVGHVIVDLPVAVGFWRAVGHSHQAFFKECFLDECAHAAGQDPLAYRLALLQRHPRHRAVLEAVTRAAGWGQPLPPAADGAPRARGLALHQSFGSIVAQVAEVSVSPADKTIRVHRIVAAIDCGLVVNPAGVRQQMESAVVYGLGAALHGEITLRDGRVEQSNFHDYPVPRMHECPKIETVLMQNLEPPEGVGEPGTPPVAPAVANALFALTGQRLRSLPLRLA